MTGTWRLLAAGLLVAATAQGQDRLPHLGYIYPAGGQRGTAFQVVVGGQYLNDPTAVYLSGDGVRATVVEWVRPLGLGNAYDTYRHVQLIRKRRAEGNRPATEAELEDLPKLPDHPLLRGLEDKPDDELQRLVAMLLNPKRQPNAQIGETVVLDLAIDAAAPPGERELRLLTGGGPTNPLPFEVGQLPETTEPGPLEAAPHETPTVELPALVNGQILPGEADHVRFLARRGQRLVMRVQARRLVPYLADAVPGWFQAILTLRGPDGEEVACADDYRFDPDPVLLYQVAADGQHDLEIRDAIYRGREDFVYRLALGELPFVTDIFPLGGRAGTKTSVAVSGWNLPLTRFTLDTGFGGGGLRWAAPGGASPSANAVPYAVGTLPESLEAEPNDRLRQPQSLDLPQIVNGRIEPPGDEDIFRFDGRAGDEVVAEVTARRLRSPLDSVLWLTNEDGRVLAWNDDHDDKRDGLLTHHADSYLRATLPADGTYLVILGDAERNGGDAFAYRLRVSAPQPDFELLAAPSGIAVEAGRVVALTVHAIRQDGFGGDIGLSLRGAPAGLTLSGGWIPRGRDQVVVTLTAPDEPTDRPVPLVLEGRAATPQGDVQRVAMAVDDMMQAFLWRSLVPARELVLAVTQRRITAPAGFVDGRLPVALPAGGATQVKITTGQRPDLTGIEFELREPPAGVGLSGATALDDGVAFGLRAEPGTPPVGYADNLIIDVYLVNGAQRTWVGLVPAIPFEVVQQG